MVDVGAKPATHRLAVASGRIEMLPATLALIESGTAKKGDVLGIARIAGIMAAKKTSELIHCVTRWRCRASLSNWKLLALTGRALQPFCAPPRWKPPAPLAWRWKRSPPCRWRC